MSTSKPPLPEDLLQFARELRREQTTAEELLWKLLRNRRMFGMKFRRQHPAPPYVLDFFCEAVKLAVELDIGQHNSPDGRASDEQRTKRLFESEIRVLRFWNNEVMEDIEGVLNGVWKALYECGADVPSPYG